jgi:RHS repeat-associated protein
MTADGIHLDYLPGACPERSRRSEINSTDSGISTHKFTGKERDSETSLDHTQFRQYTSSLARWITPDPAGLAAADPSNPQSWNRYAYVLNNPLRAIDPTGLDCLFLNDAGNGVEDNAPELDAGDCGAQGGVYFAGTVDPNSIQFDPNSDFVFAMGTAGNSQFSCGGSDCDSNSLADFSNSTFGQSSATVIAQDPWSPIITFTESFFTFAGGPGNKPTCAGQALRSIATELVGGVEAGAPAAETALKAGSMKQAARAATYAASRPNSLGGVGLVCPRCSFVFRSMILKSEVLDFAGEAVLPVEASVAAWNARAEVQEQARAGACSAAFPIF